MPHDFQHRFIPATVRDQPALVLLHGTGGDENDLLSLGQSMSPGSALLSPRGKVLEHGMPRFFRRLAEGVFDPAEVRQRANELADFIEAARNRYELPPPIAVGFSNGANVAAAIMALRPEVLAGAILLRPMVVLDEPTSGLAGRRVLILSGSADPIVPPGSADRLAALLKEGGAEVDHQHLRAGHNLVQHDITAAQAWLAADRILRQE